MWSSTAAIFRQYAGYIQRLKIDLKHSENFEKSQKSLRIWLIFNTYFFKIHALQQKSREQLNSMIAENWFHIKQKQDDKTDVQILEKFDKVNEK